MNPLNKEEFSVFLQTIKKDMPLHSDTSVYVKRKFTQGIPKNFMDYSTKVNNKFLNDNLAVIEEIQHRDSKHKIPQWFQEYQKRIYGDTEILNHDGFFSAKLHDSFFKYHDEYGMPKNTRYGHHGNIFISFGDPNGVELISGDTSNTGGGNADILVGARMSGGISGKLYDQVAVDFDTAPAGNTDIAVFSDSAGSPNTNLSETGSIQADTSFTYNSITEFALTDSTPWVLFNSNVNSNFRFLNDALGKSRTQTYAVPLSIDGALSATVTAHTKMRHS